MGSLRRLLPYLSRYRVPFWSGIGGLLLARLFEAFIPLFLRQGIDRVAAGEAALALPALAILGCVAARFVAIAASRRIIRRIGVSVAYDLRKRLYAHLQRQGRGFFATHPTGDLMARAVNDISLVQQLVGNGTRAGLVLLFSAAVGFCFMLQLAPGLTLLLLPPMPVIGVVAYLLARRVYANSISVQEGFSTLSEQVQENLNGIRTIQAHAQEENEIERFAGVNQEYADRYFALMRTNSLLASWMPGLGAACTLVIIGVGGSRVLAGDLSIGTFTAFFWYLGMVLWPVREAGNLVNLAQRGAAATTRIFEVLDWTPEIREPSAAAARQRLEGAIEVKGLTYRYPGTAVPALEDVSFEVRPGETIALIGRVGAGKSTLLRLLVRLLDPPPGSVRLDGEDVRTLPLSLVRGQVALVSQDPFLFAESLRENLAYADPGQGDERVWAAAEAADLHDTIEALPGRLETLVGERGVTLSGGQKQRTTLARGLIRDTPVVLLDDCFSSVDTETEAHILGRLNDVTRNRTTVIVSHRVSAARRADRIYVLERGRVTEMGSHDELVALGGFYASLERAQSRRGHLLSELEGAARGVAP